MKKPASETAFTLIEVLVIIFILAFLAVVLLPELANQSPRSNIQCLNNQRQLALEFIMYQNDNCGQFPWQLRETTGAVEEFVRDGHAASQFKATADDLKNFGFFICPTDHAKKAATNYASFSDANLSYFVGFAAGTNQAVAILTGDRDLVSNGKPIQPGFFVYSNGYAMNWSRELHAKLKRPAGALSFADGHAQVVRDPDLTSVLANQGSVTNRLAVP